ncbi:MULTISPECIES: serine hydrolase domain-containing protein [Streptosporangium]|uniref:D-alanyl-D-alanine carboxypeptidase n=1 Tax=Streptosporangium brasiliense TaxID=47480 RepID=A0ABT9R9F4_9ACTN|nr:serine hydrolase domain-containing protein [Streptosporangium brasiliense]MDP9865874.1 D-alanyl-D-alanine carboxypeptidase [Streptosporangium brasiliense]
MSTSLHAVTNNSARTLRASRRVPVMTALAAALLAGAAAPGAAAADSRAVAKAAARQDRPELQQAIQAFVDADLAAGVQMRVNDERGEWIGSAGVRKLGSSVKPPTNGLFRAGSVTKNFIATVVLQLVAEGKVGLDKPVADHLPQFKLDREITVRMLLQHTSGLYAYTGEFRPDGSVEPGIPATGKDWVGNRFKTYQPEELVRFALSKGPRFKPGKGWSYSNTNYTLAQILIEKVSGRSIAEEMKRRILRPLGLRHTVLPGTTNIPGPHAHGYYRYEEVPGQWKVIDVSRQNPSMTAGAGDIISTTKDLHTFFSALNSGKLIPARLLTEMREPHPSSAGVFGSYGLGLYVQKLDPDCGVVFNHNGSATAGYSALMYSTPDGKKTLTASVTTGDRAGDVAAFPKLLDNLLKEVFCGGKATD